MSGAMQETIRGQGDSEPQSAAMAPAPPVISDSMGQLTTPPPEKAEVVLMDMAREALQDLNEFVLELIKGEPEAVGAGGQLHQFSAQTLFAAAQCKVGSDGVDGAVLGGALIELKRVINQSGKMYELQNEAVTTMREFLKEIVSGLELSATPNLGELYDSQLKAKKALNEYLDQLKRQGLSVRSDEPRTVLYRELFSTVEWRNEKAVICRELGARLTNVAASDGLTDAVEGLFKDTYAALCAVGSSVQNSADFKDALKRVLCTSVKLRKAGFDAAPLDEVIQESVAALVGAHVGYEAELVKSERRILDRLVEMFRRRSQKAFKEVLGDDPSLRKEAAYVAKYFDLKVKTLKETCRAKIAELRRAAVDEENYADSWWGRYAPEWDRSVERNPWIVEGKRLGLGIAGLPLAAERVIHIGYDHCAVRRIFEFNGKELEILLSTESVGRPSEEQEKLGYRIATPKENLAFAKGLLAAQKIGTPSEAETFALGFYDEARVGDDQGAVIVLGDRAETNNNFTHRSLFPLYVRELGRST